MKILSRRKFIKHICLGSFALSIPHINIPNIELPRIGIQLYTVRKQLNKNFYNTIKRIAEIGFYGVETYTLPSNISLNKAADIIKSFNLQVVAMHSDLPIDKQRESALKMAEVYNSRIIIYHGWPDDGKYNKNQISKTIDLYNEISYFLKSKGLIFGLHNHWWEFEKHDDYFPFYYLLEHLDKDIIFELDTYWIKTANYDPLKAVKDFGKRAPLLHIKDGNAIKGANVYDQVPAGKGVIDFFKIINNNIDSIRWLIVEFDEYKKDIFNGIKESYDYLSINNLGKGKN